MPVTIVRESRSLNKPKASKQKYISLEAYKKRHLDKTRYKYEWKDGTIERDDFTKIDERYIIDNIIRKFTETPAFRSGNSIMAEADCYFSQIKAYRRSDAAYFTKEQIRQPGQAPEAPALVIEVVSPSNTDIQNKLKMQDYLNAGVQMVWFIYSDVRQIWSHTSPTEVKIYQKDDMCDARSVAEGFQISVDAIFDQQS